MDKNYIISRLFDAIENNDGDMGRNQYLLKRINKNKPIFESDKKYLMQILRLDIDEIYKIKKPDEKFILSAGHSGLALYCVIEKYEGINAEDIFNH
ncbi:MAG: hypothetical protein AABZ42_06285, partial [Thermoproteota archaeon]